MAYRANLLPADKVTEVTALNAQGPLAMVGDGINDAPAMKAAAMGIAMGSGTDVALETADAALTHNRLTGLVQMIRLARATHANVRQNITIALVERDFPHHDLAGDDRAVAGRAGRYRRNGAGDAQRAAPAAWEISA
jgi:hypothetical protein